MGGLETRERSRPIFSREFADYRIETTKTLGTKPLTSSELVEFLRCPACWHLLQDKEKRAQLTEETKVSLVLRDAIAGLHRLPVKKEAQLRSPKDVLNYLKRGHCLYFGEAEKGLEYIQEEGKEVIPTLFGAILRYHFLNRQVSLEEISTQIYFSLVFGNDDNENIPLVVQIDQIRKSPRQIFIFKEEEKMPFELCLQAGISLLAYQAKYPRRRKMPEVIAYESWTGDSFVISGGNVTLLVRGVYLIQEAIGLGFKGSNPDHAHLSEFNNCPELQMSGLFEGEEEGREFYQAAKKTLGLYRRTCSFQQIPSSARVECQEDRLRVVLPREISPRACKNCGEEELLMRQSGTIHCLEHGQVGNRPVW